MHSIFFFLQPFFANSGRMTEEEMQKKKNATATLLRKSCPFLLYFIHTKFWAKSLLKSHVDGLNPPGIGHLLYSEGCTWKEKFPITFKCFEKIVCEWQKPTFSIEKRKTFFFSFFRKKNSYIISKSNNDFSEDFSEVHVAHFCRSKIKILENHSNFLNFSADTPGHF